jgi:hypothetical protein
VSQPSAPEHQYHLQVELMKQMVQVVQKVPKMRMTRSMY